MAFRVFWHSTYRGRLDKCCPTSKKGSAGAVGGRKARGGGCKEKDLAARRQNGQQEIGSKGVRPDDDPTGM